MRNIICGKFSSVECVKAKRQAFGALYVTDFLFEESSLCLFRIFGKIFCHTQKMSFVLYHFLNWREKLCMVCAFIGQRNLVAEYMNCGYIFFCKILHNPTQRTASSAMFFCFLFFFFGAILNVTRRRASPNASEAACTSKPRPVLYGLPPCPPVPECMGMLPGERTTVRGWPGWGWSGVFCSWWVRNLDAGDGKCISLFFCTFFHISKNICAFHFYFSSFAHFVDFFQHIFCFLAQCS